MKIKKAGIGILAAGVLVAGVAVANAQIPSPTVAGTPVLLQRGGVGPGGFGPGNFGRGGVHPGNFGRRNFGRGGIGPGSFGARGASPGLGGRFGGLALSAGQELITIISDETGLDTAEIVAQVRDGATLREVIENNGGSVENVISAANAAASERIEEALNRALDSEFRPGVLGRGVRGLGLNFAAGRGVLQEALEAAGIDAQDLAAQLRTGSSLADVLTENGVDVNAFVDGLLADAQAQLDEAVAADRISAEDAAVRLETFEQHLQDRINATRDPQI